MFQKPILIPNDNTRKLYAIRGKVEGYGERIFGWWIFKSRIPVIYVRLNEKQLEIFNKTAREKMTIVDHIHPGVAPVLKLGMTKKETKEFPIGCQIGITFGYAHGVDQFLTGAEALKIMRLEVIKNGGKLEHEIEADM